MKNKKTITIILAGIAGTLILSALVVLKVQPNALQGYLKPVIKIPQTLDDSPSAVVKNELDKVKEELASIKGRVMLNEIELAKLRVDVITNCKWGEAWSDYIHNTIINIQNHFGIVFDLGAGFPYNLAKVSCSKIGGLDLTSNNKSADNNINSVPKTPPTK